jgi:hypothetical protein
MVGVDETGVQRFRSCEAAEYEYPLDTFQCTKHHLSIFRCPRAGILGPVMHFRDLHLPQIWRCCISFRGRLAIGRYLSL